VSVAFLYYERKRSSRKAWAFVLLPCGRLTGEFATQMLVPLRASPGRVSHSVGMPTYDIFILSYMGIANEIFTLLSTTVAIVITIVKAKKEIK
jgi:hypothetical protein